MTEKIGEIIKELEGIKEDFDSIIKNPIDKPLLEYRESVKSLIRDNKAETEYLEKKDDKLKKLLEMGIYEDSRIAQRYAEVLDVYKRLFLIFTKYTEVADNSIVKMKEIVKKYYITKKEHETDMKNKIKYYSSVPKPNVKKELKDFDNFVEEVKKKGRPKKEKKPRKPNPWLEHLAKTREANPDKTMFEAATLAKQTYTKIKRD